MKKLGALLLGLTLILGTAGFAADERPATGEKKTTKTGKKVEKKPETKKTEPAK